MRLSPGMQAAFWYTKSVLAGRTLASGLDITASDWRTAAVEGTKSVVQCLSCWDKSHLTFFCHVVQL